MSSNSRAKTIAEIRAAFLLIHHVATGQSTRAYMSVPANPEHDADLIVSAAIDELEVSRSAMMELVAAAREVVDDFDTRMSEYLANGDHHVVAIAERHHGARMARVRAAIAKAEGGGR